LTDFPLVTAHLYFAGIFNFLRAAILQARIPAAAVRR